MSSSGSNSRALIALPRTQPPTAPYLPRSRSTLSTVSLETAQEELWQPILHASNQVVLYNPLSHAISIASAPTTTTPAVVVSRTQRRAAIAGMDGVVSDPCPYCKQPLPDGFHAPMSDGVRGDDDDEGRWEDITNEEGQYESLSTDPAYHSRASDYFRLLAIANETSSATSGSRRSSLSSGGRGDEDRWNRRNHSRERNTHETRSTTGAFPAEKMAEGYFKTFFQEEYKLGMGANGSVFLCQVRTTRMVYIR